MEGESVRIMRIVGLGCRGMLGSDLVAACRTAGVETDGYDLPELDITRDDGGLERIPACDWVVNCAGYTDVDGAESNSEKAFAVNGGGVGRIAEVCKRKGVPLMHISTDYVFDGTSAVPYREDAAVKPLNVYGKSKLAGEKAVQASGVKYVIVRTQSLFGLHGNSFVKAILARLEKGNEPLKVVSDQVSSPTYTVHLAGAILRLLEKGKQGIVHVSASGECSWYAFACAIAAKVKPDARILPVTSAEYVRPARRPAYSVLDKGLYARWTDHRMPSWEEGLAGYLRELGK
jgi:dTDP-4-dehydrorhamnose reductase